MIGHTWLDMISHAYDSSRPQIGSNRLLVPNTPQIWMQWNSCCCWDIISTVRDTTNILFQWQLLSKVRCYVCISPARELILLLPFVLQLLEQRFSTPRSLTALSSTQRTTACNTMVFTWQDLHKWDQPCGNIVFDSMSALYPFTDSVVYCIFAVEPPRRSGGKNVLYCLRLLILSQNISITIMRTRSMFLLVPFTRTWHSEDRYVVLSLSSSPQSPSLTIVCFLTGPGWVQREQWYFWGGPISVPYRIGGTYARITAQVFFPSFTFSARFKHHHRFYLSLHICLAV